MQGNQTYNKIKVSQKNCDTFVCSVNVNRKYLAKYKKKELNAIAFIAVVRAYECHYGHKASYTVNGLHELTGVHAKTIEKHIIALSDMGLIDYDKAGKIVIFSVRSKHTGHNVKIDVKIGKKALKQTQNALLEEKFINRLRQIDCYRTAVTRYQDKINNPKSKVTLVEFKQLTMWLRQHCKIDYRTNGFIDYGWSYKNIAHYIGTSVMKAVSVVKNVIDNGKVLKDSYKTYKKLSSKYDAYLLNYTYISHGYAYTIGANRYNVCTGTI